MRTLLALTAGLLGVSSAPSVLAQELTCPGKEAAQLAGTYDFTTTVVGTQAPGSEGINSYYRIVLSPRDCEMTAELTKLGFSDVFYPLERQAKGKTRVTLTRDSRQPNTLLMWLDLDLFIGRESTSSMLLHIAFPREDGRASPIQPLYGVWSHMQQSWQKAGMWGALEGIRVRPDESFQAHTRTQGCMGEVASSSSGKPLAHVILCNEERLLVSTVDMKRVLYTHMAQATKRGPEQGSHSSLKLLELSPEGSKVKLTVQETHVDYACEPKGGPCETSTRVERHLLKSDGAKVWKVFPKAPLPLLRPRNFR